MTIYAVVTEMNPDNFDVYTEGWEEVRSVWSTEALAQEACVTMVAAEPYVRPIIRVWTLDTTLDVAPGILQSRGD